MNKIELIVYTPEGKEFTSECDFAQIQGEKYLLGILPNHSPLVSDVSISKLLIRNDNIDTFCAVGEGLVSIENNVIKLMVDSFETADQIDVNRALASKKRAEERLESKEEYIDYARAKASLKRALNRIDIARVDL